MVYVIGLAGWRKAGKAPRKQGRGVQNGEPFRGSRCWLVEGQARAHVNALDRQPEFAGKFDVYRVEADAGDTYTGEGGVRRLSLGASVVL